MYGRSHYGNTFAAAHQDGTLAVWDRRSGRLVAKVRRRCSESKPGYENRCLAARWIMDVDVNAGHVKPPCSLISANIQMDCDAAARCVKFAKGPVDLLAFSEHEDQVGLSAPVVYVICVDVCMRECGGSSWVAKGLVDLLAFSEHDDQVGGCVCLLLLLAAILQPCVSSLCTPRWRCQPCSRLDSPLPAGALIDARRWNASDILICKPLLAVSLATSYNTPCFISAYRCT